jgi:hypothetical protein
LFDLRGLHFLCHGILLSVDFNLLGSNGGTQTLHSVAHIDQNGLGVAINHVEVVALKLPIDDAGIALANASFSSTAAPTLFDIDLPFRI